MQPVAHSDTRCPHCGTPRIRSRRIIIWLGVAGLVALIFVIGLMIKVIRDADFYATPPDDPNFEQNTTPTEHSQPDKPPPLNK